MAIRLKELFKTKAEAVDAFNQYQLSRAKIVMYNSVRRKAIRKAYAMLRRNHSSEYNSYLHRFTDELTRDWRDQVKGGPK